MKEYEKQRRKHEVCKIGDLVSGKFNVYVINIISYIRINWLPGCMAGRCWLTPDCAILINTHVCTCIPQTYTVHVQCHVVKCLLGGSGVHMEGVVLEEFAATSMLLDPPHSSPRRSKLMICKVTVVCT